MKINTKMRYGLRTMIELGVHNNMGGILQKDIALRQDLSEKYLDQIISALKIAGLIKNERGKKSGYMLTRDPERISVYEIMKAFDSDLAILDCLSDSQACEKLAHCAARNFWFRFNCCIDDFLKKYTLKQLVDEQIVLENGTQTQDMYYI